MPVFQHAAGDEPEIVFVVGRFRRRLVGHRDDAGLAVLVAVELDTLARLHTQGRAPREVSAKAFLAVDRPAQATDLMVEVVRSEIMAMAAAERCVFLGQGPYGRRNRSFDSWFA